MSTQENLLRPDFRERAKANNVPVARLIGFEGSEVADGHATITLQPGHNMQIPWGRCTAEFAATLLTPRWVWPLQPHSRQRNPSRRSS